MSTFDVRKKIRFGHTDPAGIMFYPRYFELLNEVVEDWFADELGMGFGTLLADYGVGAPLGDVQTRFKAPCRMGEHLLFRLTVVEVRRAKVVVNVSVLDGANERIRSKLVLVCAKKDMSGASDWPKAIHSRMCEYQNQGSCS